MPPAPVPAPVWPGAAGRAGPGWRGARGSPRRLHPSNALGRRPGQPKQEVCNSLTPGRGYFPPGGPALAPLKSPGGVPGGAEDRAGAGVPRRAPPPSAANPPPHSLPSAVRRPGSSLLSPSHPRCRWSAEPCRPRRQRGQGGLHQGDRAQALRAQTQDIPGDTRAEDPVAPSGRACSSVGEPGEVPEGAGETHQLSRSPTAPFPLGLGDLGTPPVRPSHPAGSCRRSRDRRCFGTPVGTSPRSVSPAALAAPGTEPGKQPLPKSLCQGWAGHGPLLAGSRRTATSVPKEGSPCCCRRRGWHPFGTGPQVGRAPTTRGWPVAEGRVLSGLRPCQTRGQRGSRRRSPLPLSPLPWHLLDGFLFTAASAGVRSSHGLQGSLVTLTLRRGEGISGGSRDTPTAPAAAEDRDGSRRGCTSISWRV